LPLGLSVGRDNLVFVDPFEIAKFLQALDALFRFIELAFGFGVLAFLGLEQTFGRSVIVFLFLEGNGQRIELGHDFLLLVPKFFEIGEGGSSDS
jgi:hypothetical protein